MKDKIKELKEKFGNELESVADLKSLEDLRLSFLSKKGHISALIDRKSVV